MKRPGVSRVRRLAAVSFLLLAAGLIACGAEESDAPASGPEVPEGHGVLIVQDVGLDAPQSILYDSLGDAYLVSNSPGADEDREGRGFISRLTPKGKVETLRWIGGGSSGTRLNAPKGMALRGDTLYVADLECVRLLHRVTGRSSGSICLSGNAVLNDVTVDADGVLYATGAGSVVADPGAVSPPPANRAPPDPAAMGPAIYRIELGGRVEVALQGEELGIPNGIAASPRGIFFSSLKTGTIAQLTPSGPRRVLRGSDWSLQGIVFLPDGSFAFSNRSDSTVLYVRAKYGGSRGEVFTLVREVSGPGDLGYDSRRGKILIPQPGANRVYIIDVLP